MRHLLTPLAVSAAIAALLVWAFMPRPVPVDTATVQSRDLVVTIQEEGEARIREVFTVSAPFGGKLARIDLHAGDSVEAGTTIVARIGPAAPALLDARSRAVAEATLAAAEAAVDLAQAQIRQSEALLENAATQAVRARSLFERGTLSQQMLDAALLAERTAEAAAESARATLVARERERDSARAVLAGGDTAADAACCLSIPAPVSGRILRVMTEDEQVVQPGTPLLEIGNPGNLEISVDLLSRDAVRVAPDALADITGWGGLPLVARVTRVEPAARTKVSALGIEEQRVRVFLAPEGAAQDWQTLGHGFRVIAAIRVWEATDIPAIPIGALFRDGSDWATFVVQDGRANLRRIDIGERNSEAAHVIAGLEQGDTVILHPGDGIKDGTRVTPR